MSGRDIQPEAFLAAVKPLLERQDLPGLLAMLKSRWTAEQIVELLKSRHCDARKVAALALSLVGGACCLGPLSAQLKDPDPVVNEMAEHALWSIWFRSGGSCEANHHLARGAQAMERQDLAAAIGHFTKAIEIDPKFAEAYNQRAIARFLCEEFDGSVADCERAAELMPCHWGAWAGLGHCHAHEGRLGQALECYRKALAINPHQSCLVEACEELERQMDDDDDEAD